MLNIKPELLIFRPRCCVTCCPLSSSPTMSVPPTRLHLSGPPSALQGKSPFNPPAIDTDLLWNAFCQNNCPTLDSFLFSSLGLVVILESYSFSSHSRLAADHLPTSLFESHYPVLFLSKHFLQLKYYIYVCIFNLLVLPILTSVLCKRHSLPAIALWIPRD